METVSTELKEGTTLTSRQVENIGRMVEHIKRKSFKMEFECPPPFISPDVTAMTEYDKSWPLLSLWLLLAHCPWESRHHASDTQVNLMEKAL